jgi:hypothetical protein
MKLVAATFLAALQESFELSHADPKNKDSEVRLTFSVGVSRGASVVDIKPDDLDEVIVALTEKPRGHQPGRRDPAHDRQERGRFRQLPYLAREGRSHRDRPGRRMGRVHQRTEEREREHRSVRGEVPGSARPGRGRFREVI